MRVGTSGTRMIPHHLHRQPLAAPSLPAIADRRYGSTARSGRARFLCLVRVAAEHAADGVHAGIVALHFHYQVGLDRPCSRLSLTIGNAQH